MQVDITIIGAGVVGSAAAALLGKQGFRVALVDAKELPKQVEAFDLRVYTVGARAAKGLSDVAQWQPGDRATEVAKLDIWQAGRSEQFGVQFDANQVGLPYLATVVEERELVSQLSDTFSDQIEVIRPTQFDRIAYDDDTVSVQLVNGQTITSKLLIAADGARSNLRARLDIAYQRRPYGDQALVCHLQCAMPHQHTAFQRFFDGSVLALLPLPGHRVSLVWSASSESIDRLNGFEQQQFEQCVTEATESILGELKLCSERVSFPLAYGRAETVIGKRAVLIGDAAHSVHPLAGLGVNMGFGDVFVLMQALSDAKEQGIDIGSAALLRRYERRRLFATRKVALAIDGLYRLFNTQNASIGKLRGLGLRATNKLSIAKRWLMQQAGSM